MLVSVHRSARGNDVYWVCSIPAIRWRYGAALLFDAGPENDPKLIAEYKRYHEKVWPEILQAIRGSGIEDMEIYLLATRMFMIMEVNGSFSFEAKRKADEADPKTQEWEALMWKYQQALPQTKSGEKWMKMERIFKLAR